VRYGEDLVGDKYDSNEANPIIRPGPTPLDNCGAESKASGNTIACVYLKNPLAGDMHDRIYA
jgi:hypothetical protein